MHESVVADAGGLLVLAGLLEGLACDVNGIVALDATSLLVAEYLALRNDGAVGRTRAQFASVGTIVEEWIPVRGIAVEAVLATSSPDDIDGAAALTLAESLGTPLVTRNDGLRSDRVPVLRC